MKEKIKYLMGKKSFHIAVVTTIISIILLFLVFILIKYNVEGETNMPFNLTKIILISSVEGVEKEPTDTKWAFNVSQNTDVYVSLIKNEEYQKKAVIKSILIDNIQVEKQEKIGTIEIYRPNINETGATFKNSEENQIKNIEYIGAMETSLKDLKIANQGGTIVFRCANNNMSEYTSNDDTINHSELFKKVDINEEKVKGTITFDIIIKLEGGKEYKATISKEIPTEGLIENGKSATEITNLEDIVFKRVKN